LDLGDCVRRIGPWSKGERSVAAQAGLVDIVDENEEEGGGIVIRLRLEVGVGLDDERGGDDGEQTSLLPLLTRVHRESRRSERC